MVKKDTGSTKKRRPSKRFILIATLALAVLIVGLTAWVLAAPTPEKAVIGKWTNAHGGVISFYADGTGFVPGVEGVISDTNFTYSFPDHAHVKINVQGQGLSVKIKIEGDKMTWGNSYDTTEDVYMRTR